MKILRGINGLLRHVVRDVSVNRVMHLTSKVRADVGDLREEAVLYRLMSLVAQVEARGVKVLMVQALSNHILCGASHKICYVEHPVMLSSLGLPHDFRGIRERALHNAAIYRGCRARPEAAHQGTMGPSASSV